MNKKNCRLSPVSCGAGGSGICGSRKEAAKTSKRAVSFGHTQGAGKSLEMVFLAGRLISDLRLANPTLVMVTDRQDLDG